MPEVKTRYFYRKIKKTAIKFCRNEKMPYLCTRLRQARALSSVGLEHLPYKQRVGGSTPSAPTKKSRRTECDGIFHSVPTLPPLHDADLTHGMP